MGAYVVHHFYVDTIAKAMFLKASLYRLFCTVTFLRRYHGPYHVHAKSAT
jgi:hypothetical protein